MDTYTMTGLVPVASPAGERSHLESGSTLVPNGVRGVVSLQNPLVVFGVVLAATVGLIGVSGSVRLGGAKASASFDKA